MEDAANNLLQRVWSKQNRVEKSDVLTPWKERERRRHELFVAEPDPAVRQGMFGRAYNPAAPHLNSTLGVLKIEKGDRVRWDDE